MQPPLTDYGIQLERSDIRVHVSPATRRLFVFQTAAAQKLLEERGCEFKERYGYQQDVEYATSKGKLVPCYRMPTLRTVELPGDDWWARFDPRHKPSTKGRLAALLVERALREGLIPLPLHPSRRVEGSESSEIGSRHPGMGASPDSSEMRLGRGAESMGRHRQLIFTNG